MDITVSITENIAISEFMYPLGYIKDAFAIGATSGWMYSGKYSASLGNSNATRGIRFSNDGTRFYVSYVSSSTYKLQMYTVSVPWDISTAVLYGYGETAVPVSGSNYPRGFDFSMYGTDLYVISTGRYCYHLTMSTPWDITTAVDTGEIFYFGGTISSITYGHSVAISSDGRTMIISGGSTSLYEFTLSTPFNINTASYSSNSFVDAAYCYGLTATPDGAYFLQGKLDQSFVSRVATATPWSLSGETVSSINTPLQTGLKTFTAKPDGSKYYLTQYNVLGDATYRVHQYNANFYDAFKTEAITITESNTTTVPIPDQSIVEAIAITEFINGVFVEYLEVSDVITATDIYTIDPLIAEISASDVVHITEAWSNGRTSPIYPRDRKRGTSTGFNNNKTSGSATKSFRNAGNGGFSDRSINSAGTV